MNELYLQCQYNNKDKMIVSNGTYICFEIFEGEGESKSICIDEKQVYTLIEALKSICNERLD